MSEAQQPPLKQRKQQAPKKRDAVLLGTEMPFRKPGIQRLAHKGGVKRIAKDVYQPACDVMVAFLQKIVADAVVVTTHCGRSTLQGQDVLYALKENGVQMY